jgi:hypothetical protein
MKGTAKLFLGGGDIVPGFPLLPRATTRHLDTLPGNLRHLFRRDYHQNRDVADNLTISNSSAGVVPEWFSSPTLLRFLIETKAFGGMAQALEEAPGRADGKLAPPPKHCFSRRNMSRWEYDLAATCCG